MLGEAHGWAPIRSQNESTACHLLGTGLLWQQQEDISRSMIYDICRTLSKCGSHLLSIKLVVFAATQMAQASAFLFMAFIIFFVNYFAAARFAQQEVYLDV